MTDLEKLNMSIDVWESLNIDLSKAIAYHYNKELLVYSYSKTVAESDDVNFTLSNLDPSYRYFINNNFKSRSARFVKLVKDLPSYVLSVINLNKYAVSKDTYSNFDLFLKGEDKKISRFFIGISSEMTGKDESFYYPSGYWESRFLLNDYTQLYDKYHFKIEVYSDENRSNMIWSIDSSNDTAGWYYEYENNIFSPIPTDGVPVSFAGRRIVYKSLNSNLMPSSGYIFYTKVYHKVGSTLYGPELFSDIAFS